MDGKCRIPSSTGVKDQAADGWLLDLARSWEAGLLVWHCLALCTHSVSYERVLALNIVEMGKEMAPWFRAWAALPENLGSSPSTHIGGSQTFVTLVFLDVQTIFWPLQALNTCGAHIQAKHLCTQSFKKI